MTPTARSGPDTHVEDPPSTHNDEAAAGLHLDPPAGRSNGPARHGGDRGAQPGDR